MAASHCSSPERRCEAATGATPAGGRDAAEPRMIVPIASRASTGRVIPT